MPAPGGIVDSGVNAVNAVQNVSDAQYEAAWQKLFATLLYGFWGRFFFLALLGMALFFGVRRRNPRMAIILVVAAVCVAFGGWFLKITNIM